MPESAFHENLRTLLLIDCDDERIAFRDLTEFRDGSQRVALRLAMHGTPGVGSADEHVTQLGIRAVVGSGIGGEDDEFQLGLDEIAGLQLCDLRRWHELDGGAVIVLTPLGAIGREMRRGGFATEFTSFAYGTGGGSYINNQSTVNSSVAYIGAASDTNNWGTKIQSNAGFGLGSNRAVDQTPLSGEFSGPTSSVLDLWLSPNTGSTLATTNTYLGSFTLDNAGSLTFTAVPEPGTYILLAIAGLFLLVFRRRKPQTN